jgi:hypothetical protein
MALKDKGNNKVIENNGYVKRIITLYTKLFSNYQDAAEEIKVNRDTIARYNAHKVNIALNLFDRMSKVIKEHYTEREIRGFLDGLSIEEIRNSAKQKNGAQIDHVMYNINDEISELLKIYTNCFSSKAMAAKYVGINPRTFKAYLDGQIKSIPRKYFWKVVKYLNTSGYNSFRILDSLSCQTWEQLLEKKERSVTLQYSRKELIESIIDLFDKGTIRQKDISRSIHNASKRLFGNLGEAIRVAMRHIEKRNTKEIEGYISIKDAEQARQKLGEFEKYIKLYAENEKAIWKASPKNKRKNWREDVERYAKKREVLDRKIGELVSKKQQIIATQLKQIAGIASYDSQELHAYSVYNCYIKGDIIDHPAYGMGKVLRIIHPRRMVVQFEKKYGKKILLMNDKNPRPEFWGMDDVSVS